MAIGGEQLASPNIYLPERQRENILDLAGHAGGEPVVVHSSNDFVGTITEYGIIPTTADLQEDPVSPGPLRVSLMRGDFGGEVGIAIKGPYEFDDQDHTHPGYSHDKDELDYFLTYESFKELAFLATADEVDQFFTAVDPDCDLSATNEWPAFIAYGHEAVDRVMTEQFDIGKLESQTRIVAHIIERGDDPEKILGSDALSSEIAEKLKHSYLSAISEHIRKEVVKRNYEYAAYASEASFRDFALQLALPAALSPGVNPNVGLFAGATTEEKLDAAARGLIQSAYRLRNNKEFEPMRSSTQTRMHYKYATHILESVMLAEVGSVSVDRKRSVVEQKLQIKLLENALDRHNSRGSSRDKLSRAQVRSILAERDRISGVRPAPRDRFFTALGKLSHQNG